MVKYSQEVSNGQEHLFPLIGKQEHLFVISEHKITVSQFFYVFETKEPSWMEGSI